MKKLLSTVVALSALVGVFFLALPSILRTAGLHPEYHGKTVELPGMRALIITTSHGVLAAPGETDGSATGVAASELTRPYYTFLDGGMSVDVASIKGGDIPIDPKTLLFMVRSPEDKRFLNDSAAQAKVQNSIAITDVDVDQYEIVFIAGGWGAAYDPALSPDLATLVSTAYYDERAPVIGGVCHGVLGLVNARDRDVELLIARRRMTGVTDKQIKELDIEATPRTRRQNCVRQVSSLRVKAHL